MDQSFNSIFMLYALNLAVYHGSKKAPRCIVFLTDCSCVRLILIDTAGLHPFPAMRELRMRGGNAFLLVFSYDVPESLDEVMRLHQDLRRIKGEKFDPKSVICVGNKTDLLSIPVFHATDDPVSRESKINDTEHTQTTLPKCDPLLNEMQGKARALVDQLGCPLIETSAFLGRNVLELFHSVLWPMLLASWSPTQVSQANIAGGCLDEDSSLRRQWEAETVSKKISWPWRNESEHPTAFLVSSSISPSKNFPTAQPDGQTERQRKISRVESEMLTKGKLSGSKDEVNRKFSMGSRLVPSPNSNYLQVNNYQFNRPASRSHSVDNSLVEKAELYRDSNSTCSPTSGRSYSSLSSVEKENFWKLSVHSDTRCKFGRFLSPSPKGITRECEAAAEKCPYSLDYVQEVGYYLDPSNRPEDSSESLVPQIPCLQLGVGRRGRASQSPRERIKKLSVFGQPNFHRGDQIYEANESTISRSEHEINLIVPGPNARVIADNAKKGPNCKIS
ncbi:unnamed protein product [Mesocestoides corti]|uniref:Uncharacterized protein n=2 Tax=Mesocestoides corti TaxID=53468 RepID=A0A158QU96_MESCO|nr:unnamed protein product [Mesocestoides corti]